MKLLGCYDHPVERNVCSIASQLSFKYLKKKTSEKYKGHAKTHYHRGRPMNCKKSPMTLGKNGNGLYLSVIVDARLKRCSAQDNRLPGKNE